MPTCRRGTLPTTMMPIGLVVLLSSSAPTVFVVAQQPTSAPAHLEIGNDAYSHGDLETAAAAYEACLDADPALRYCAVNLASVLVDGGDPDQNDRAESLYRSALQADPTDGDTSYNLATLLQDKKTDEATREAAKLYGVAVQAEPDRWDAWANLATALSEIGERPLDATHAFERAILIIEKAAEESGEGENAERDAYLSKLYYGYGTTLAELSPEACRVLASDSRSLLLGDRDGLDGDGTAEEAYKGLCTETAQNAMRSAAILDATNVQAAHMLAAMVSEDGGTDGVHRRASPEFVAALFDDFADTFDKKLGALEYNVPAIIGAAAARARPATTTTAAGEGGDDEDEGEGEGEGRPIFRSALDAGCGTGLAGQHLRPLVSGPMVGVDISQKMLDNAAKCTLTSGCGLDDGTAAGDDGGGDGKGSSEPLYDGLMALDLEAMTLDETLLAPDVGRGDMLDATDREGFDLVVAADVLVYFGRLDAVLGNFAALSRPGASLMFTCERATDEEAPLGWRLLSSGRFAHTKSYVLSVATELNYELEMYEEIVPRMERGVEVKGHIFHFVLSPEGGGSGTGGQKEEL